MNSNPKTKITLAGSPTYKWRLQVATEVFYEAETAPCWFHRVMLRMILGWKWERL